MVDAILKAVEDTLGTIRWAFVLGIVVGAVIVAPVIGLSILYAFGIVG